MIMKLELITRQPQARNPDLPPLLFVHGAFSHADIWNVHFLPFFAEHGFSAHAVSLRGHGRSEGRTQLRDWRLSDYVADVAMAVAQMPAPPVLIGHSMGGVVVQKYLRRHQRRVAGAVLMGSGPPHGMACNNLLMALRHPVLFQKTIVLSTLGPKVGSLRSMRSLLFSGDVSDSTLRQYAMRLVQPESKRVVFDLLWPLAMPRLDLPILVLGARNDVFISPAVVNATARYYRAHAAIISGLGHAMMLDARWRKAADALLQWLVVESTFSCHAGDQSGGSVNNASSNL
jgi:pimeloyl-ACP methyl ester carboxylesterase